MPQLGIHYYTLIINKSKDMFKDNSKLKDINWVRVILFVGLIIFLSSCSPKLTPHQVEIDYELEKAYLEYSYQRDSLIIEFYKK